MSPYDPSPAAASNTTTRPGAEWLQRLVNAFPHHAWINPLNPRASGSFRQSISLIQQIVPGACSPHSDGLEND